MHGKESSGKGISLTTRSTPTQLAMRKLSDPSQSWDSVPFESVDLDLPAEPGVYIVCAFGDDVEHEFPYIGQAVNIRRRWQGGHHQALPLLRYGAGLVRFFLTPNHKELEKLLIEHYEPPINQYHYQHKKMFVFDPEEWREAD